MEFTRLTEENVITIKKYLEQSPISFCDISVGAKYMWRKKYVIDFCILNDTLVMKEKGPNYDGSFYYPIGNDVDGAVDAIENYCKENFLPFKFCCIDDEIAEILRKKYFDVNVFNERAWNDYIYTAQQFKTYSGKSLSGQRNHVNKFKKAYPNYKFESITPTIYSEIADFLAEYERNKNLSQEEKTELDMTKEYLLKSVDLGQVGGVLRVDGKIVGLSIGEVVGDTLIVHVEKGLTGYNGVYPTVAQEFAKAFATDGVKYINREEDCGDEGLRRSKTQYHPIEIKRKNAVVINTLFYKIPKSPLLKTERLTIGELSKDDKQKYFELYVDDELNKWWGYDYKDDLVGKATPEWFFDFQNSLKIKQEEFSFAVKADGKLIGELVLHNFDYYGGVEMGFRFFKDCQGKGYATESGLRLKEFVKTVLGANTLKSRCFKENVPSKNLIGRLGLNLTREDKTHYYFSAPL